MINLNLNFITKFRTGMKKYQAIRANILKLIQTQIQLTK